MTNRKLLKLKKEIDNLLQMYRTLLITTQENCKHKWERQGRHHGSEYYCNKCGAWK